MLGFGGAEIGYNANQTQAEVDELLNSALDAGLNVIDTAAAYKTSEELIGNAVGERRKDFYSADKMRLVGSVYEIRLVKKRDFGNDSNIFKEFENRLSRHRATAQLFGRYFAARRLY